MISVVPKWIVEVKPKAAQPMTFHIFDAHLSNVLRMLTSFDFGQVQSISVTADESASVMQYGTFATYTTSQQTMQPRQEP